MKVVPADDESLFDRLLAEGLIHLPSSRRAPVEPVDAGGADTTSVLSEIRR